MAKNPFAQADLADTVIAQGIRIKGDVTSDNDIWIDGQIEGDVRTHGNLNVGENGMIDGNLAAYSITIAGSVKGNLQAEQRVICESSAKITGNLRSADLTVNSGAAITGEVAVLSATDYDEEE